MKRVCIYTPDGSQQLYEETEKDKRTRNSSWDPCCSIEIDTEHKIVFIFKWDLTKLQYVGMPFYLEERK